jgi:hypothetical protein
MASMIIINHDLKQSARDFALFVTGGSVCPVACIPSRNATSRLFFPTQPQRRFSKLPANPHCTSRRAAVCCRTPPHLFFFAASRRFLLTCFLRE